jgi:hypothetical protein
MENLNLYEIVEGEKDLRFGERISSFFSARSTFAPYRIKKIDCEIVEGRVRKAGIRENSKGSMVWFYLEGMPFEFNSPNVSNGVRLNPGENLRVWAQECPEFIQEYRKRWFGALQVMEKEKEVFRYEPRGLFAFGWDKKQGIYRLLSETRVELIKEASPDKGIGLADKLSVMNVLDE